MIAVDSSVVIAGFASWHEKHHPATEVLKRRPRLVAHAAVETYSVLTRLLPPPHRAVATLVDEFLQQRFPDPFLCLSEHRFRDLITTMAGAQVLGGRIYDAMIGLTAAEHGATLVTLDRRAALVYDTVGVSIELPGS